MRALPFLFGEAFVNLRRHALMTVAAITTIAVALALIGSFALTFYQINVATKKAVGDFEMRVFCRTIVKPEGLRKLRQRIVALPGVGTVGFISKEQAFADAAKNLHLDTSGLPNQFNDTFIVKLREPNRANSIANTIRGWTNVVQEVALPESEMGVMLKIASQVRTIGIVGGVVLLFGALVVVSNTIRISLFARRREIKIMQIVGAAGWFIRLPLLIEGLIHGVAGGILAGVALIFTAHYIDLTINQSTPMLLRYFQSVDMIAFGIDLSILGAAIGLLGSFMSVRRYLRIA